VIPKISGAHMRSIYLQRAVLPPAESRNKDRLRGFDRISKHLML
jgi:hypothetical protein